MRLRRDNNVKLVAECFLRILDNWKIPGILYTVYSAPQVKFYAIWGLQIIRDDFILFDKIEMKHWSGFIQTIDN